MAHQEIKCPFCKCVGTHSRNCQFPKVTDPVKKAEREARKKAHYEELKSKTGKNKRQNSLQALKEKQKQENENE